MPVVGTQTLADLAPDARELARVVGQAAQQEIQPLGRRILAEERRRVMNVQEQTFEKRTRVTLSKDSGRVSIDWIIDHPGADIQDTGGTIKARKLGSRLLFFIPGVGWRSPEEVTLPARPYLSPAMVRIASRSTAIVERRVGAWLGGT